MELIKKTPTRIKILLMGIIFAVLILSHFILPAQASKKDPQDDQIHVIEQELNKEKEQLFKFGKKEQHLLDQLSELEQKILSQRRYLNELKRKIRLGKTELSRHQKQQKALRGSIDKVEQRLYGRLVAFYKYGKSGYSQLIGTSVSIEQFRKRIKYLKVIMAEDRKMFQDMVGLHQTHQREIRLTQDKLTAIETMEETEQKQLVTLKKDLDAKVILLMKIHKEKEFYETAVKELEFAAASLKNTLQDIEKQPPRTQALPKGFEKEKGMLPLPFPGKVIRNKKNLMAGAGKSRKGIFIKGPSGGDVTAVYGGRVDYSGWLKGYGQIIVINHGSRYFSVSGHLLERFKENGDMVEQGEVIGLLGQTEYLAGPLLYFELRRGSENLNPFRWLKGH